MIERNGTEAFAEYERLLETGVAKEVARLVLAALDLHEVLLELQPAEPDALLLACGTTSDAQYEIRQYAAAAEDFLAEHMPVTHAAFIANDRTAP